MTTLISPSPAAFTRDHWQRYDVRRIEDLRNVVLGAELQTMQMAGKKIAGSLAFSASDGIIFSSGLLDGNASAKGILSKDSITFGIGLSWGTGSRVCLQHVVDGCVGVILPGGDLDVLFAPGTLYVAATMASNRIDETLLRKIHRTGLHPRSLDMGTIETVRSALIQLHNGQGSTLEINIGRMMHHIILPHYTSGGDASLPHEPHIHETIVRLARDHIERHLAQPISMRDLAEVSGASTRTFYRAFLNVLGETPNSYIRRLRLHRVRDDLISRGLTATVASSAKRWGINEYGRMSGWYREVFGERPSATLSNRIPTESSDVWL
jgi:AraC-like DNA-binding protein